MKEDDYQSDKALKRKEKQMSGYSKIYCIVGEGGFMGSDGMNPIDFQILVDDGNRQWLEVKYFNRNSGWQCEKA